MPGVEEGGGEPSSGSTPDKSGSTALTFRNAAQFVVITAPCPFIRKDIILDFRNSKPLFCALQDRGLDFGVPILPLTLA
jgi:hypothetical protein